MKKVLGGVAVAAVMACGWAGGARASVIRVDIVGTVSSGSATFFGVNQSGLATDLSGAVFSSSIVFDTDELGGGVSANGENFDLKIGSVYRDAVRSNTITIQEDVQAFLGDTSYFNDIDDYSSSQLNFVFADPQIASLGFVPGTILDPITSQADYHFRAINANTVGYLDAEFDVSRFSITAVPLPASAPLFGAALLALGAAGYGMRRRAVPA